MRKIKFRGKRIDTGEWIYGWLVGASDSLGEKRYITKGPVYQATEVDPETVGQFTEYGLYSGDIYEGDLIKVTEEDSSDEYVTAITYEQGAFVVDVNGEDFDITALGWAIDIWDNNGDEWEVIGNKWDNPELSVQK